MSKNIFEGLCNPPNPKTRKQRAYDCRVSQLLGVAVRVFEWQNLPANLPQWEIESRLILTGRCCVFNDKLYGVITSNCSTSGVDLYNHASEFNFAQAVIGSASGLKNMIDGVIGYGTSLDKVTYNGGAVGRRVLYYADLLSDIDVSRQIALINGRATSSVIAKSDNALRQLTAYYKALYEGDISIPKIESGVLDSTEPLHKTTSTVSLAELDSAELNITKRFYADFGIAYTEGKKERLIVDEVESANDSLDSNLYDMLDCRVDFASSINSLYGTSISVGVRKSDIN